MDKRKSVLNIGVSVGFKLTTIVAAIIVKRYLIQLCGNEINGLNALYLSIIDFLTVAELGVGSAITFCMYRPIVEGKHDTVSALYHLFKRLYWVVGGIILLVGLALTPFIHHFAKDYASLNVNLEFTFFLMLISVVATYLFGAQLSLFNAYKNNYIATAITSGGLVVQYVLQIVALVVTKSFAWFIICRTVSVLLQWGISEAFARRDYAAILINKRKLEKSILRELVKNIKAMFMHKVGFFLVSTADNVIISMFVGVVALGEYSNYSMIMVSMMGVIRLVFTSLTSIWGHLYAEESKQTVQKYCEAGHLLNFWIGILFFLGYYAVADNLVAILFSRDLIVVKSVPFVIALNGFVQYIRENTLVFREATGTFYNDRWKPLLEGLMNVILSVVFVKKIGITGVIVATVITNLIICHVIEPYVLYKNAFETSPRRYYFKNYGMIAVFFLAQLLLDCCLQSYSNEWLELFVNGSISVAISIVVSAFIALFNKEAFRFAVNIIKKR